MQSWLIDDTSIVREFAQNHIASLDKNIEYEQKRADMLRCFSVVELNYTRKFINNI